MLTLRRFRFVSFYADVWWVVYKRLANFSTNLSEKYLRSVSQLLNVEYLSLNTCIHFTSVLFIVDKQKDCRTNQEKFKTTMRANTQQFLWCRCDNGRTISTVNYRSVRMRVRCSRWSVQRKWVFNRMAEIWTTSQTISGFVETMQKCRWQNQSCLVSIKAIRNENLKIYPIFILFFLFSPSRKISTNNLQVQH